MTLTLKESCRLYEQHCRRRVGVPTFEDFNVVHSSCLPTNQSVYQNFKHNIELAYKAEGLPVTRRLPSLFQKFSNSSSTTAKLLPSVQMPVAPAPVALVPPYEESFQMTIRAPIVSMEAPAPIWSLQAYQELVRSSANAKMQESNGMIVHLMPPEKTEDVVALACKLTKSAWNAFRGRTTQPLTMRDGSELLLSSVVLRSEDVKAFIKDYRNNVKGPFFIRFSRI